MANHRNAYGKHQDEQYEKLNETELDETFSRADTSSKENFLASVMEKLQTAVSLQKRFFLKQISAMPQALFLPGSRQGQIFRGLS